MKRILATIFCAFLGIELVLMFGVGGYVTIEPTFESLVQSRIHQKIADSVNFADRVVKIHSEAHEKLQIPLPDFSLEIKPLRDQIELARKALDQAEKEATLLKIIKEKYK